MQWTTVGGLVPGDLVILPIVAVGLLRRDHADQAAVRLRHRLFVPALIIGLGSMLALIDIGLTSWAARTLLQDVIVTFTFLGVLSFARSKRFPTARVTEAIMAAGLFVSVIVLAQGGYRPAATFAQTNMTAHFIAACFVFTLTRASTRRRLVALPIMLASVVITGSFGALLSLAVVVAWFGYGVMRSRLHRTPAALVMLTWGLLVGGIGLAASSTISAELTSADTAEGLSAKRLDRSGEGRKVIWLDGLHALRDDPLGIGPGGFKPLKIHVKVVNGELDASEIHHDTIGYVVERGYIGFAGLCLLVWVLWSSGRKRNALRGLLIMNGVAGLFRETLHFRHLWIFVALALAGELSEVRPGPWRVGGRPKRFLAAVGEPTGRPRSRARRLQATAGVVQVPARHGRVRRLDTGRPAASEAGAAPTPRSGRPRRPAGRADPASHRTVRPRRRQRR